ncbi:3-methyl-2-oxobutanoate hydroxymethyltransferase [Fonsecaea monophora]|uniref:3-methyl-2-oxobutanoate hydroxymethyltransferase n=1 Tax=Fonsecaea monophora TaxID=254056 RepID=A0A177ETE6_9EURO|nr:3-methyl-2-oxobutanoate hydroxymethyltransferase [Fonsecaea monophora]KAH0843575.1 3-methyl-2-oxobutanoate hydroxymethyltransferase [Fonsecaea pedrosoi]OAG34580.1 3-methyl-2-oxobutanoate hydroxymethyltransferase [Fonsecaea monophora]
MAFIVRINRIVSLTRPLLRDICRPAVPQSHRQWRQVRWSSHAPSSPALLARGQKPVTIQTLQKMYAEDKPITMLTAHNFPSALMAQEAGMDMILVGDSLAMVSLGMQDTSEVTLDEMIVSARAVSRAVTRSFTVGDLPMGSYELSPEQALASAIRMIKEGRMQSVKLEGGVEMAPAIKKITSAGIPVCAHIGLTPQRQHALGGFRVQGNTLEKAMSLLKDAKAVEEAGAFVVVLECVPPDIAEEVTKALRIPTIGIGAGNKTSGQVLVQIDMLGVRPPDSFMPKFVKKYGSIWEAGLDAIKQYKNEVGDRSYPGPSHVYKSDAKVTEAFKVAIQSAEEQKA